MDHHALARLEEARQAEGVAATALEARRLAGGTLCYGGPGSWQNQAVGLALEAPISEAELDELITFFAEREVPAEVIVCPYAHPSLLHGLAQRGLRLVEMDHVLWRPLHTGGGLARDDAAAAGPSGLEVRAVRRERADEVAAWIDVSTCGFRPEGAPVPATLADPSRRMLEHPGMIGVIACLDGAVVGAGALEVRGPLAALMATSVRPEHRRVGVQQALIGWRLAEARRRGAELATIQCFPGIPTERNALRAGFQVAYTRAVLR